MADDNFGQQRELARDPKSEVVVLPGDALLQPKDEPPVALHLDGIPAKLGSDEDEHNANNDDDENSEDDSDVDYDDSDSTLNDILAACEELEDQPTPPEAAAFTCTPEECKYYKARLHQVGLEEFVKETVSAGSITARKLCTAFGIRLPYWDERPDSGFYRILGLALLRELESRQRLEQYNTFDDVVRLLQKSSNILVITGAGISTNLGVPDFRSKDTGFYAKMADKFDDPQDIFEISTFDEDPSIFFSHSAETLPAPDRTSPTHAFIKLLETQNKLLTNYTQNIDNVEGTAGISPEKLIQCHGSWATFTCRKCAFKAPGAQFYAAVKAKQIPTCPRCVETLRTPAGSKRGRSSSSKPRKRGGWDPDAADGDSSADDDMPVPGVMKPDITFFGEKLPDIFFDRFVQRDRALVDLVIVIGTSMTVAPVSEIPAACAPHIPTVYISRDPVRHFNFDVVLLGDCDVVCAELARRAGWNLSHHMLPKNRRVECNALDDRPWMWSVRPVFVADGQAKPEAHEVKKEATL